MKRLATSLACAVALIVPLDAAMAEPTPLALRQAIEVALERSPVLKAAQQQVNAADAGVDRARAEFLPKLDVLESFTRSDNPVFTFSSKLNQGRFTQNDFAVTRLNEPDPYTNFRTAVQLSQPLYTGGKASIGYERAKLGRLANEQALDRRRQDVIFRTARAYYAVLLADADLAVVQSALRAAAANRDVARARVDAGLVVESDALSAEVRLATLREQEIVAQNRAGLARAALNDVMGRPLEEPVEVAEQLAEQPLPRAELAGLETLALARRPDYRRLGSEEQGQERAVAAARAEFLPTLSATASWEANHLDVASNGRDSWFVGALIQWNLFNGFGDRARIAEATARLRETQALRGAFASQLRLEVREAFLALRAATERITVARQAARQAEESLRIVRDRYESGLTTVVTLLSAEAALTQAQGSLTRALYDQSVGAAGLELALGTIDKESFR